MKHLLTCLIVAAFPLLLFAQENSEPSPQQKAVLKVEQDWLDACKVGDAKRVEAQLHNDFELTGPTGMVMDKEQYVGAVREKVLVLESAKLDETKVRIYGDAAVVSGLMVVAGRHGDFDFTGTYRFTDTLIKHDGKWQKVAGQMTPIH